MPSASRRVAAIGRAAPPSGHQATEAAPEIEPGGFQRGGGRIQNGLVAADAVNLDAKPDALQRPFHAIMQRLDISRLPPFGMFGEQPVRRGAGAEEILRVWKLLIASGYDDAFPFLEAYHLLRGDAGQGIGAQRRDFPPHRGEAVDMRAVIAEGKRRHIGLQAFRAGDVAHPGPGQQGLGRFTLHVPDQHDGARSGANDGKEIFGIAALSANERKYALLREGNAGRQLVFHTVRKIAYDHVRFAANSGH